MSDYEQHSGKLRKVPSDSGESLFELVQRIYKEEGLKWDDKYTEKTTYFDEIYEKYFIIDKELYKVIEHIEEDECDSFMRMHHESNGDIVFSTRFYNGGTCLSEMIEDGVRKLNK